MGFYLGMKSKGIAYLVCSAMGAITTVGLSIAVIVAMPAVSEECKQRDSDCTLAMLTTGAAALSALAAGTASALGAGYGIKHINGQYKDD
jgi:hypothetical protein